MLGNDADHVPPDAVFRQTCVSQPTHERPFLEPPPRFLFKFYTAQTLLLRLFPPEFFFTLTAKLLIMEMPLVLVDLFPLIGKTRVSNMLGLQFGQYGEPAIELI